VGEKSLCKIRHLRKIQSMRAIIVTALFLILLVQNTTAQNLITVQNGGNPTFYNNLDSAIIYAQNGDTVYLPGGGFSLSVPINKRLHIIGVGHNPDSTLATNLSQINGTFSLNGDASNGSICGVYISGCITDGSNISSYSFVRCRVGSLCLSSSSANWSFIENVIHGEFIIASPGVSNFFFSNNIIDAARYDGQPSNNGFNLSDFRNNIFLRQATCYYWGCYDIIKATGCSFSNNIFLSDSRTLLYIENSAMFNNLFVEPIAFPPNGSYWSSNNIVGQQQASIFINQAGFGFSYSHDYQLQSTCPGKNAGKDGTDIGVYGGAYPWKTGSLPTKPHVQYKTVSDVHPDGNIHVVIKVAAQNH
jgi:hypothetical protein